MQGVNLRGVQEENMDIEKMSSMGIGQHDVKSISEKCRQLKDLQEQLKKKNEELDHIKFKVRDMEERIIPEMMQEAGVSLLKLSDGSQVEVKPFYAAKIPESRVEEAFGWLRSNGHEDLIKNPEKYEDKSLTTIQKETLGRLDLDEKAARVDVIKAEIKRQLGDNKGTKFIQDNFETTTAFSKKRLETLLKNKKIENLLKSKDVSFEKLEFIKNTNFN